jgi:hypothetical protein
MDATTELRNCLRLLLANPYPFDLLEIRREVREDFAGDEELAREEMDCWCSEELALREYQDHRAAINLAEETLNKFDKC